MELNLIEYFNIKDKHDLVADDYVSKLKLYNLCPIRFNISHLFQLVETKVTSISSILFHDEVLPALMRSEAFPLPEHYDAKDRTWTSTFTIMVEVILTDGDLSTLANMKLNLELNQLATDMLDHTQKPTRLLCNSTHWEDCLDLLLL
ncbi:hypothetical protein HAX54_012649 [Datura stramonium]|uniref:Uncharacterized protein n=1 Tax=Datura stramonium TaxID=4076 RepID=A0ABS8TK15_DATST|nr:hypothetical protein [Datura stramonium]